MKCLLPIIFTENRRKICFLLTILVILLGTELALAAPDTGRFSPSHTIVKPVYCGTCHPEQVIELGKTTHLAEFSKAVYNTAKKTLSNDEEFTEEQAIAGACMMCHGAWNNRDSIYIAGYDLSQQANKEYRLTYNDITSSREGIITMYDIPVNDLAATRLGSNVIVLKVAVQSGDLPYDSVLINNMDYIINGTTGIDPLPSNNISILKNSNGSIKITYKVVNQVTSYKQIWADLSAISPSTGYVYSDIEGKNTCGNLETGSCHFISSAVAYALADNTPLFQHDMAYTSTEYTAKQVKLCGVCHTQKLPPMTADGEPITARSEWAHSGVQCIRCHAHAGISNENKW